MNKADRIKERLEAALGRIESALESAESGGAASQELGELTPDQAAKRVASAEAESLRLQDELKTLKGEHAALREITDAVSERLDAAIGELRAVLED